MDRLLPYMLVAVVAGFFGVRRWMRSPAGAFVWDRTKLKLPIAGKIIRKATMARFARSFALASRSGHRIVWIILGGHHHARQTKVATTNRSCIKAGINRRLTHPRALE